MLRKLFSMEVSGMSEFWGWGHGLISHVLTLLCKPCKLCIPDNDLSSDSHHPSYMQQSMHLLSQHCRGELGGQYYCMLEVR